MPGLGLGLTITKLLAELMGGEIAVLEPPAGQGGALFRVRLMLAAAVGPRRRPGAARRRGLPRARGAPSWWWTTIPSSRC